MPSGYDLESGVKEPKKNKMWGRRLRLSYKGKPQRFARQGPSFVE
jgi:hypothetical protein